MSEKRRCIHAMIKHFEREQKISNAWSKDTFEWYIKALKDVLARMDKNKEAVKKYQRGDKQQ